MAKVAEKQWARELKLLHTRASDYREHRVDGTMSRIEGSDVVLTFYLNDTLIKSEEMELVESTDGSATYKPKRIVEDRMRTDLVSVRISIQELFGTVETIRTLMSQRQI